MKILTLKLKNIHSLKGEHSIDFANGVLGDAGLFVITGPTGAGKSTLLDAITLAIYNKIPRISKLITSSIIEEEGVVLTKNTTDGYVEVEYSVNSTIYRSSWTISRARTGKLKERLHELINVTAGNVIITSKISDVPTENEKIIGLNYEQFIQSMILAQGQFSKLLLAKKSDRNALLEEITGTGIYREIGRKVNVRFKIEEKKVEDQKLRMGENFLLSEEAIQLLKETIEIKIPRLNTLINQKNELDGKKVCKESIVKNQSKKVQIESEIEVYLAEKLLFKPMELKLEEHVKFSIFKEPLNEIQQIKRLIESDTANLIQNNGLLLSTTTELQLLINQGNEVTKKSLSEDDYLTSVESFRTVIQQLVDIEKEKESLLNLELSKRNDRIKQLKSQGIELDIKSDLSKNIQRIISDIDTKSNSLKSFDIDEVRVKKDKLITLKETANKLVSNKQIVLEKQKGINELKQRIEAQTEEIPLLESLILKNTNEINRLIPLFLAATIEVEKALTHSSLENHRKSLIQDEPCPLCGALDHPFSIENQLFVIDVLKENRQLIGEQKENAVKELSKENVKKDSILKSLLIDEETLKNRLQELSLLEVENETKCTFLEWGRSQDSFDNWEELSLKLEVNYQDLSQLENLFRAKILLLELQQNELQIGSFTKGFQEVNTERTALYSGNDIHATVNSLIEKWRIVTSSIDTIRIKISETTRNLKNNKEIISQKEVKLITELKTLGVTEITELSTKILDEQEANNLRVNQLSISSKNVTLQTTKNLIDSELAKEFLKDDASISLEQLSEKLIELTQETSLLQEEIWGFQNQLKLDDEKREQQKENQLVLDRLQKDLTLWSKMNLLIGDATGNKFSNFVQDLTLKQLIEFGNKRLEGFSDRYLLKVDENAENLHVIDTYMGNTQRAVSSLSGGESFKLSLALAFGLSDLAAKNVNIESLFIDEGFGTLDPESLDQAITILEHMQHTTNKSIGIISHVGELKDRIGAKIKLVKSGAGYSSIEIE